MKQTAASFFMRWVKLEGNEFAAIVYDWDFIFFSLSRNVNIALVED